jgi:hypothetical protein
MVLPHLLMGMEPSHAIAERGVATGYHQSTGKPNWFKVSPSSNNP